MSSSSSGRVSSPFSHTCVLSADLIWPSPSCLTVHLGLQGNRLEIPGATDVALTLVEAVAQRDGKPPCDEQWVWPVTGPDSCLLAEEWFLGLVIDIIEPHVRDMPVDLEAGFGSMAGLRRRVVVAFLLRCASALSPLRLAFNTTGILTDHPCTVCSFFGQYACIGVREGLIPTCAVNFRSLRVVISCLAEAHKKH